METETLELIPTLSPKRQCFVDHYITCHNATEAVKLAGYAKKNARQRGAELLSSPDVKRRIAFERKQIAERAKIKHDDITKELSHLAFFDVKELYDESGSLLPLHELDSRLTKAIAQVNVTEAQSDNGSSVMTVTTHIKPIDKLGALKQLREHLGMINDPGANKAPMPAIQINFVSKVDAIDVKQADGGSIGGNTEIADKTSDCIAKD